MSQELNYDLCVIGGGLNGVSIARDAAGRGLSVLLVESQDLAGATSSATSKMMDGGVTALEKGAFLPCIIDMKESENLYRNARHLLHPLTCVMPLDQNCNKSAVADFLWCMKLRFYNFLKDKNLFAGTEISVLLGDDERLAPLRNPDLEEKADNTTIMKPHERLRFLGNITQKDYARRLARKALVFAGCRIDDTRLVICTAVDAAKRGAEILTYTKCDGLQPHDGCWRVKLRDMCGGDISFVNASMVVNATGPWVCDFIEKTGIGENDPDLPQVGFVKESHIILPRQYEGNFAYMLRQEDGRIVYVMPYEGKYTLVGASREECPCSADPGSARISEDETRYLISACNKAFEKPVRRSDVVFAYSALHPVLTDDYYIYHHKRCDIPVLSIYGGKTKDHRILAQETVDRLMSFSGRITKSWTASEPLASADFKGGLGSYISGKKLDCPWLPEKLLQRYVCAYGTQTEVILGEAVCLDDLGEHYGGGIYEAELNYLREHEWVSEAQDVLWRRSKLALCTGSRTEQLIEEALIPKVEEEEKEEEAVLIKTAV